MNVLISGYYGFHNIGDEAILKSIITALKEENPNIQITVLSNDVEHTKNTYNVNAINRWNLPNIYIKLLNSDGLISGGGSLLQDVTSSRSVIYYTSIIFLANMAKKPVFVYAQGIGPISKNFNKKIVKHFLNKSSYITLRDKESEQLLKTIGVNKDIDIVPDPVMGFSIENIESDLYKEYNNKDYITISVRDWNKAKFEFFNEIAKACDEIVKNGIDVVFVPMHGQNDENASKDIVNMMKYDAKVLSWNLKMEEKMTCIKYSKLMIGMRLHALIFAATVQTPMIGISYDPKIDSYLSLVNQPCIGSTEKKWYGIDLANQSLKIIKNYDLEKSKLINSTNGLKECATLTAHKALNIFSKIL